MNLNQLKSVFGPVCLIGKKSRTIKAGEQNITLVTLGPEDIAECTRVASEHEVPATFFKAFRHEILSRSIVRIDDTTIPPLVETGEDFVNEEGEVVQSKIPRNEALLPFVKDLHEQVQLTLMEHYQAMTAESDAEVFNAVERASLSTEEEIAVLESRLETLKAKDS